MLEPYTAPAFSRLYFIFLVLTVIFFRSWHLPYICQQSTNHQWVSASDNRHHGVSPLDTRHHGVSASDTKHHGMPASATRHHGISASDTMIWRHTVVLIQVYQTLPDTNHLLVETPSFPIQANPCSADCYQIYCLLLTLNILRAVVKLHSKLGDPTQLGEGGWRGSWLCFPCHKKEEGTEGKKDPTPSFYQRNEPTC